MRKLSIYSLCFLIILVMVNGCENRPREEYIDFIKISDNSYLGVTEVIDSLDVPWDMQFSASTNSIFFTEIKGSIFELNLKTKEKELIYTVPNVFHKRTMGLLGLAVHPDFKKSPYLYACYTTQEDENYYSELVRLKLEEKEVTESKVLLRIGGALGHNGSRLAFDNDGFLYWATGDALSMTDSQDSTTLNGKILRMTDDGSIPSDNPIVNSYVYAWGFRNIQGLTVTSKGEIMASEHGDAIEDEVNHIKPLQNYGWKEIEGYHDLPHEIEIASNSPRTEPIRAWTPVIAPAAVKYYNNAKVPEWDNSLLLTTLKTQSLRVLKLNKEHTSIVKEEIYLKDYYGRIRSITTDNAGNIYIATSNRDWNPQKGFPKDQDDRILKISPVNFAPESFLTPYVEHIADAQDGKALYKAYCASCHKEDGKGVENYFPSLVKNSKVANKHEFAKVVLEGMDGSVAAKEKRYDQAMPAFNFLSDSEIAAILTYVRADFENNHGLIDSIYVNSLRSDIN